MARVVALGQCHRGIGDPKEGYEGLTTSNGFVGGQFVKVWGRSNLRKNRLQTIGNITRITSMHT